MTCGSELKKTPPRTTRSLYWINPRNRYPICDNRCPARERIHWRLSPSIDSDESSGRSKYASKNSELAKGPHRLLQSFFRRRSSSDLSCWAAGFVIHSQYENDHGTIARASCGGNRSGITRPEVFEVRCRPGAPAAIRTHPTESVDAPRCHRGSHRFGGGPPQGPERTEEALFESHGIWPEIWSLMLAFWWLCSADVTRITRGQ
jgi:hypothetical protein